MIREPYNIHTDVQLPVILSNTDQKNCLAPLSSTVRIAGLRASVHAFLMTRPALHLDTSSLASGLHTISITPEHLLLPQELQLVNYSKISVMKLS